jgi:hypothetical protein
MKGPHERLKYDLRRVWECPVCTHKERTPGHVTTCLCRCQQQTPLPQQRWMRLVEDGVRRVEKTPPPPPLPTPPASSPQSPPA